MQNKFIGIQSQLFFKGLKWVILFYRTTLPAMAQQAVFNFLQSGAKLAKDLLLKVKPEPATGHSLRNHLFTNFQI